MPSKDLISKQLLRQLAVDFSNQLVDHYKGIKYLYINNLIGKYAKII